MQYGYQYKINDTRYIIDIISLFILINQNKLNWFVNIYLQEK